MASKSSPSSASNCDNSPAPSALPMPAVKVDDEVPEQKPDLSHFRVLGSLGNTEKYRKYEAEYTCRLMGKYFSRKNLYGGDIFDDKTRIDEETIMSSRWPSTRTFANPVKGFEELRAIGSKSET